MYFIITQTGEREGKKRVADEPFVIAQSKRAARPARAHRGIDPGSGSKRSGAKHLSVDTLASWVVGGGL